MKYGEFLKEKGTLGFVAPSFGCNIEPYHTGFLNAVKKWEEMEYQINLGPNVFEGSGIGISNTPQLCAKEFMDWYTDEKSDVLISCGGGELMCGILEYIDFEALAKAAPKWFMGFSDNTNLTFLLTTLCDTASIYGPCAAAFGMEPWHDSLKDAFGILCGKKKRIHGYDFWEKEGLKDEEHPLEPYNVTEPKILRCFPEEQEAYQMEGRLLGGCLDSLITLCGTEFDRVKEFAQKYEQDGIIWYLEACDLNPIGIRRAIWQLSHAGWFQNVKGFLIGRPLCFGEDFFGMNQYKAVVEELERYHVPIIMDADIGHLPPMMPLVCGSYAKVNVQGNDIEVNMEFR